MELNDFNERAEKAVVDAAEAAAEDEARIKRLQDMRGRQKALIDNGADKDWKISLTYESKSLKGEAPATVTTTMFERAPNPIAATIRAILKTNIDYSQIGNVIVFRHWEKEMTARAKQREAEAAANHAQAHAAHASSANEHFHPNLGVQPPF